MAKKELKELLFEITEYFGAEENGSVAPEQLLKANTLILYKDLYICVDDEYEIHIFFSYYEKIEYFTFNQYFIANNFEYKDKILIYKNFLLAENDDDSKMIIVKFINNNYINDQLSKIQPNKLLENVIHDKQIISIGYLSMQFFKANDNLIIQDPIESIINYAFFKNKWLHNIKITANLEVIASAAFASSSLSSIQIDKCICFEPSVFQDCLELETCQLPNNLLIIDNKDFENCKKLKQINLEDTQITSIPNRLFYNCQSLTSITIPNSVSSIGHDAFYGCTKLSVISFENFDHVVATNIYDYHLPNNLSIIIPSNLFDQWKEVEEAETPGSGYYSIEHLVCKHT